MLEVFLPLLWFVSGFATCFVLFGGTALYWLRKSSKYMDKAAANLNHVKAQRRLFQQEQEDAGRKVFEMIKAQLEADGIDPEEIGLEYAGDEQ